MIKHCIYVILFAVIVTTLACKPVQQQPAKETNKRGTLKAGDTLSEALTNEGFQQEAGAEIIGNLSKILNPRFCKPGDVFEAEFDTAGKLQHFYYYTSGIKFYSLERLAGGNIQPEVKSRTVTVSSSTATGKIRTSLWEAMSSQGITPDLINDFTEKFAWQVDFLTEPRAGDTFKVVWEKFITDDGKVVKSRILAAQYSASGHRYTAVLYNQPGGKDAYFSPDGKLLRRMFLKAPLQYARISSYFTRKRFHPILRIFRPHLGIDYAAPSGTPVSTVADGVVTFAGRKGGFGNYIIVRHVNSYASYYGHLKGYHKGIQAGTRVLQGQVIGYVGSTGLSTGPHLDFRFSQNGRFINFIALKLPETKSITTAQKESFRAGTKDYLTKLAQIR